MKTGSSVSAFQHFNAVIKDLSRSRGEIHDLKYLAALNFIRKKLKDHNVDAELHEVINECYLRGLLKLQKGEVIINPLAWIRSTAYNVIREMSRSNTKAVADSSQVDAHLEKTPSSTAKLQLEQQEELSLAQQSFNKVRELLSRLKEEEQLLVELKWLKGLSWEAVAREVSSGGKSVKTETVKKRGQRAVAKIRKQFLKEGGDFPDF